MRQTYGGILPHVRFNWSAPDDARGYRLVIARDAEFDSIVYEEELAGTEFSHGNLDQGSYYWRVSAVNGDVESLPSAASSLRIEHDEFPPDLQVALPDKIVDTDELLIRGTTEPDAEVVIGTEQIAVRSDGTFEYRLELRRGPNLIVIEAVDPAGNVTYRSQYVNARFQDERP